MAAAFPGILALLCATAVLAAGAPHKTVDFANKPQAASNSGDDVAFLSVNGTALVFRGKPVFLSGANQPWVNYGNDFGNNQPNSIRCTLQEAIHNVSASGGNSIRMWVFVEGANIPAFDSSSGMCVGTDGSNTLIEDLRQYAREAAAQNVLLTLCLWNGAVVKEDDHVRHLVSDASKLQSFIDKVSTSDAA